MATVKKMELASDPVLITKKRHRSPNYPAESLEAAIQRTQKLYAEDHAAGSPIAAAAVHIGFNKAHGEAMSVLAGMKKFGLVEIAGGRVTVTKRAVNILLFPDDERGRKSLREAVLMPDIYRKLAIKAKTTGLLSDKTMRAELIADYGFNPKSVDAFLKDFRASLAYAGISLGAGVNSFEESSLDEQPQEEEPELKTEEEISEQHETPVAQGKTSKSKVFNVALDPITNAVPQFAQVLIPVPLSDDQKKRLINFLQNL